MGSSETGPLQLWFARPFGLCWLQLRPKYFRKHGPFPVGHEPKPCVPGAREGTVARFAQARPAQSAERKALNLVVVGSSPTVGVFPISVA